MGYVTLLFYFVLITLQIDPKKWQSGKDLKIKSKILSSSYSDKLLEICSIFNFKTPNIHNLTQTPNYYKKEKKNSYLYIAYWMNSNGNISNDWHIPKIYYTKLSTHTFGCKSKMKGWLGRW